MPCPHNEITIVQRSQRQSAVAAAAYQSGEKLFCEYDQQVKHYPEKRGIVHNEILLPANAPPEYADRNTLWNAAEAVEKQWNSQLARRWVLTIPREIPPDQYAVLVREFCEQQFVSKGILVDLHKMTEGHLDATIMVAYLKQLERTDEALSAATAKADRILNEIEEMVAKNCTAVDIAYTPADLCRLKKAGKKAVMLGIENGYAIGKDITNVERFRHRGVVYMTLCHNGNNDICGSARYNEEGLGVSTFGEQVIKEMNRVGMMVDVSHAGEKSFYDALAISGKPIVASHSSARALCDHPRNLTDDQLKALAAKGGVAQVCMYGGFLRKNGEATIKDAIEHLNHMVNVMGIEHVGIGTDFDGDGGITGCASASELINFTRRLLLERYSEENIRLIWGGNFLRVMEEVQRK